MPSRTKEAGQELLFQNSLIKFSFTKMLGKGPATKWDDFLEKFQTAFDPPPPPLFWKILLQFLSDPSPIIGNACQ